MNDVTKDPGFWNWLNNHSVKQETYQPLYAYIDSSRRTAYESEESSDTGIENDVSHVIYQV